MNRLECIKAIAPITGSALVLTTAGGTTHEWWAFGDNRGQLMVKTLGLGPSIGLGLALSLPTIPVIALDGDGALLMNLYELVTAAAQRPRNLIHVCFDNGVYESSGSVPTMTARGRIDLCEIARGSGVERVVEPETVTDFEAAIRHSLDDPAHTFVHAKVEPFRAKVDRIPLDEVENRYRFAARVRELRDATSGEGRS